MVLPTLARWSIGLWLFIVTGLAQDNVPDVDSFNRAARWKAVVLDDWVYIDGGEVSQEGFTDYRTNNPINATLSIDCTTSWYPEGVTIQETGRPPRLPVMLNQAIFEDTSTQSFYIWGGYPSRSEPADSPTYWRFTTDGNGGGRWDRQNSETPEIFSSLEATQYAASVSTPGAAFVFGGKFFVGRSDNAAGFLQYNFSSKAWTQSEEVSYSRSDGSLASSSSTFVGQFGLQGIIVILGGIIRQGDPDSAYLDFRTVHFYDIDTQTWHQQVTTGDIPYGRHSHCAVGTGSLGNNDTYEIFVYGGGNDDDEMDFGDIHVLSLPGFRWTKVSDEADRGRAEHACVAVRSSQLLSFGGLSYHAASRQGEDAFLYKDNYPRGIGIFDMNSLEWKEFYDAEAGNYTTHESIKSWYDEGGMDSIGWSSPEIEALFLQEESEAPEEDDSDDDQTNREEPPGEPKPSSTPIAAIVAGSVGGAVAIAIVAVVIWCLLRRRRKTSSQRQHMSELADPMKEQPRMSTMPAELGAATFASWPLTELDGSSARRGW